MEKKRQEMRTRIPLVRIGTDMTVVVALEVSVVQTEMLGTPP